MKLLNIFICLLLTGMLSCNKGIDIDSVNSIVNNREGWVSIDLNIDYTIQFPPDTYTGQGYKRRSSPNDFGDRTTVINRKDQQSLITATFCNPNGYPCLLIQYGESISIPLPKSVPFRNYKGEDDYLTSRNAFEKDGKLIAILYYGPNYSTSLQTYDGRLYTVSSENNLPKFAGVVRFNESTKQEVLDILATITPK